LSSATAANAQSVWKHTYSVADTAEQITSCQAGIEYSNGMFQIRIYGEALDFFFFHQELAVPANQQLGNVVLTIKDQYYVLPALSGNGGVTGTSSALFLTPEKSEYTAILDGLRFGSSFDITFPDGTVYTVELTGSADAVLRAFQCWKDNFTGPGGKNPFVGGTTVAPAGNNPFN
jgi:hypothetical protein